MIKSKSLLYAWHLVLLLSITKAHLTAPQLNQLASSGCDCSISNPYKIFDLYSTCGSPLITQSNSKSSNEKLQDNIPSFPSLFISHGAPSIVLDNTDYVKQLRQLAKSFPKPKAIALFSAHWESPVQMISSVDEYSTIYDFSGFPREMYSMKYPAKGDHNLAKEIKSLFEESHINSALDYSRGLDHGAWTILKLIYPEADIPVVSLSVNPDMCPEMFYKTGAALKSLKKKGVMIVGSGGTVHNLGKVSFGSPFVEKWAQDFDNWIAERVTQWKTEELFNYLSKAPYARDAVPDGGREHFLPLFIAMGAGADERKASKLHQSYQYGTLSLATWEFI